MKRSILPQASVSGLLMLVLLSLGVLAVSANGQPPNGDKAAAPVVNENYRIGPGDVVDVIVTRNESLSRPGVRVSYQGTIQLPMLDEDVSAACLTEKELAERIKEKYRKYLVNPYITVGVREFNANPVSLIGAVQTPGRFQIQRPTRLLELLTLVNGPSAKAGRSIEIIRNPNRPYCQDRKLVVDGSADSADDLISLSLTDAMGGVEAANPFVRGGDLIRVVEADQVNAYIQGSVKSSAMINLKDPVTLSEAVAMAGGLAPGAAADKVVIRRQVPNSINRSQMIVNLKAISQGKRDDVLLEANDIVEVPGPSGAKKFFNTLYQSLIPTVVNLPTRVVY
jgi:polysaccharide biosynthesis/export protein